MIDRLAAAKEFDLLAMARVLGGIVFKEGTEQAWFRRRFTMFQDLIETSWVYQEIGQQSFEKGIEEGIIEGQRKTMMSFLQARFPEVIALANQQTNKMNSSEILQTVIDKLFVAQTLEEAKQILLEVNKQ